MGVIEATKTNWKICPDCKEGLAEDGLANVEELQAFYSTSGTFFSFQGKILWLGRNLEGGLGSWATS